jgi:hypothetical protein
MQKVKRQLSATYVHSSPKKQEISDLDLMLILLKCLQAADSPIGLDNFYCTYNSNNNECKTYRLKLLFSYC